MNPPSLPSFFSLVPAAARSAAAFCAACAAAVVGAFGTGAAAVSAVSVGDWSVSDFLGVAMTVLPPAAPRATTSLRSASIRIGPAGVAGHFFTDNGDARRSTDEQDTGERRLVDARGDDGTVEGAERVDDARAHGRLELVTRDAHLGVQTRHGDRDGRLGVVGQRFLRRDAVGP